MIIVQEKHTYFKERIREEEHSESNQILSIRDVEVGLYIV